MPDAHENDSLVVEEVNKTLLYPQSRIKKLMVHQYIFLL